jgi:ribosomal protein L37AE/L43A
MNGGIVIQERRCPRCGNRRTVRRGSSSRSFCFNCRYGWTVPAHWSPFDPRTW